MEEKVQEQHLIGLVLLVVVDLELVEMEIVQLQEQLLKHLQRVVMQTHDHTEWVLLEEFPR